MLLCAVALLPVVPLDAATPAVLLEFPKEISLALCAAEHALLIEFAQGSARRRELEPPCKARRPQMRLEKRYKQVDSPTVRSVGTQFALLSSVFRCARLQKKCGEFAMSSDAKSFLGRNDEETASNKLGRASVGYVPPADPLTEVIAGCRRRESRAQRDLVVRTQDRVYRTLIRLVGMQDAEDVSQQVYLQIFRQLDRFHGDSSFGTWLYRVTVNEAMQHLRRRGKRSFAILDWEPQGREADLGHQSEARELLDRALAQIEPELRSIFVLREVEGLPYEAIGAAVGIPMGTVASRLSRARHDLQERLRALGWTG